MLLLSVISIIPTNVSGEYIENIDIPSEVKEGETFTASFDASYFMTCEVYASLCLCDSAGNLIKNKDGYIIPVECSKDKFVISETPMKRNVKCEIKDQSQGMYKLAIGIYEADTDELLPSLAEHTPAFELVEGEKDDNSDSSSCMSSIIIVIPVIIGLMILVRRKN